MRKISINKIVRDLWQEKGRTIVVLIAIILGTFSVAMMTTAYSTLNRNLRVNYEKTNPADADRLREYRFCQKRDCHGQG